jgi:hypothetical protein
MWLKHIQRCRHTEQCSKLQVTHFPYAFSKILYTSLVLTVSYQL